MSSSQKGYPVLVARPSTGHPPYSEDHSHRQEKDLPLRACFPAHPRLHVPTPSPLRVTCLGVNPGVSNTVYLFSFLGEAQKSNWKVSVSDTLHVDHCTQGPPERALVGGFSGASAQTEPRLCSEFVCSDPLPFRGRAGPYSEIASFPLFWH